jgi:hypothetical protein
MKTKHKIMILIPICVAFMVYIITAFIIWSLDLSTLGSFERGLVAFVWLGFSTMGMAYSDLDD